MTVTGKLTNTNIYCWLGYQKPVVFVSAKHRRHVDFTYDMARFLKFDNFDKSVPLKSSASFDAEMSF